MDGTNRHTMWSVGRGLLLVTLATLATGCSTLGIRPVAPMATPNPGTDIGFSYERGEGRMTYPLGIAVVEDAVLEALNEDYKETRVEAASDGTTRIESRSGLTRTATIRLQPVEGGTLAIVRIGPFPDAQESRKILDRVSGRTGLIVTPEPPSAAAVAEPAASAEPAPTAGAAPDAVLQRERAGIADGMSFAP